MQRRVGYILLIVVLALIALGMVMLFSTSAKFATDSNVKMYASLRHQCFWLIVGTVACVFFSRCDYHLLTKNAWWGLGIAVFLLALCFVPHLGSKIKGSWRWIHLGGMTLQPSEFAKLSIIVFLAYWLGRHQRKIEDVWSGFLAPILIIAIPTALILKEPDLGSTLLIGVIMCVCLFCAGTRLRYLLPVPIIGGMGILTLAYFMPERRGRLLAFMDPEKYKMGDGYQVLQALIAFGSGGPTGLGLGNSRQKMFYLPESNTDFIFPIIGEELGMWVALAVVFSFLLLALCGGWISLHAPDNTGVYLGIGITTLLCMQAFINMSVVTSMLPNKGLPLPFISYGGSNLVVCLSCIGILFNLQRQGVMDRKQAPAALPRRNSPRM